MHQLNSTAPQASRRVSSGVTFIRPKSSTGLHRPGPGAQDREAYADALEMVRVSGATDGEGKAWARVNGDYAKTEHMCNRRALYEKLEDASSHKVGLWCDASGKWTIGDMKNAGEDVDAYATTTLPTNTASPECACVVFNPGPFSHAVEWIVYVGGRWEQQEEMAITGIPDAHARRRPASSLSAISMASTRPRSHHGRWYAHDDDSVSCFSFSDTSTTQLRIPFQSRIEIGHTHTRTPKTTLHAPTPSQHLHSTHTHTHTHAHTHTRTGCVT